jgi:hypothetical protein
MGLPNGKFGSRNNLLIFVRYGKFGSRNNLLIFVRFLRKFILEFSYLKLAFLDFARTDKHLVAERSRSHHLSEVSTTLNSRSF